MADAVHTDVDSSTSDVVAGAPGSLQSDADAPIQLPDPTTIAVARSEDSDEDASEVVGEADDAQPENAIETGDDDGVKADADADSGDESVAENGEMLSFDFGGNKLEVPKDAVTPELAERIDKFTKGTWSKFQQGQIENVERSKSLDAREGTVANLQTLNGEALQTYSYGLNLRSELAQLGQLDLNAMWQSQDPADRDRARQVSDLIGSKNAELQQVIARVGEQEQAVLETQRVETGRRVEEGTAYLDRHIKNFSSEKATTLVDYVVTTYGMPREQADRWAMNPVVTRMAYKAMLFDRQAGASKRPNPKPSQAMPVRAAPSAGGAAGAERDPNKMSMGQLAKHLGVYAA